jgi:cell division septal protein FtsQ
VELTPNAFKSGNEPSSHPGNQNVPPPAERFLRGRHKRTRPKRRLGKILFKGLFLLVGLIVLASALVWTATAFGRAPGLNVNRVLVEGNQQLSDGEILELLEFSEGANILMLDLEAVRAKLLRSAWVSAVEVERVLPSTLKLEIRERQPVAIAVLDELYLMASDGTMLDQLSPRYDIEKLVLARGLRDESGLVLERAALAGRLADELSRDNRLMMLVSEIDVSEGDDSVTLQLRAPAVTALVHGDTMVERLLEVVPLLDGIEKNYAELDVVDLRFKGRAYLRLRDQPDTTETTGSGESAKFARAVLATGGAPF